MNKKRSAGILSLLAIAVLLISTQFVSAAFVNELDKAINNYVNPITKYIVGDFGGTISGELLLVKFLFFIVILALVYYGVRAVPNIGANTGLTWFLSITMAILAIRYIRDKNVLEFMWLPTGALGVALVTMIPFIIFLFFIERFNSKMVIRIGWVTFAVVYFMLAAVRWSTLGMSTPIGFIDNLAYFYLMIGLLSFFVMMFDPKIRVWVMRAKSASARQAIIDVEISRHNDRIEEYRVSQGNHDPKSSEWKNFDKQIRSEKDKINKLMKEKAELS